MLKLFNTLVSIGFIIYLALTYQAINMCGPDKIGFPVLNKGVYCVEATHWSPTGGLGK